MCEAPIRIACKDDTPLSFLYQPEYGPFRREPYEPEPSGNVSVNAFVEGEIHNPLLTDCIEQKTSGQYKLDHEILFYLQSIKVKEPQIVRRFILACMDKQLTEKDLIWLYHMKDTPLNGTLPKDMFIQITKQQLEDNTEFVVDKDYEVLADSYLGFSGDHVRYVNMCNDIHSWRVLHRNFKEYPLKQIYPPYRYPLKGDYPRAPQGNWEIDKLRRDGHELPTITLEELGQVSCILQRISRAMLEHRQYFVIEKCFHQIEKLKDDKTLECGLIPHHYLRVVLGEMLPLKLSERELEILTLYFEHPFILHFFRYRDFLLDIKFEMGEIDPTYRETPEQTRKMAILAKLKKHVFNTGLNMLDPFKDFDSFGQGYLNRSHMKRALHVLNIGYGLRCNTSCEDLDFLFDCYAKDEKMVNYKQMLADLNEVFIERFYPGGRLSMVLESFEPNLAHGPYCPPRPPFLTKEQILKKAEARDEILAHVINRLKMLVIERRIAIEPIFKVFDLHHFRYVQSVLQVPRILQLCNLPVTPDETDAIMAKYSDKKGFRYMDFLHAIDTQSYPHKLPSYPITLATVEDWKHKRLWYPDVIPQDIFDTYKGPQAIIEKCRRQVFINRLRVSDYFVDYDINHRGNVTRKQFRRCTAMMRIRLSPIENLILENEYVYENDLAYLNYKKFVTDMDLVFAPKDVNARPAVIPQKYNFAQPCDRLPIGPTEIALAQEGFRKIAEKVLELRCHIDPYFHDFDPLKNGGITPNRFRRMINGLGLDIISEVEWKALIKYFTRSSQPLFDYRKFLNAIAEVGKKRDKAVDIDPRLAGIRTITDVNGNFLQGFRPEWNYS